MRQFSQLLAGVVLASSTTAAFACINDRESIHAEKEFKSSYIENQNPSPTPPSSSSFGNDLFTYGGSLLGVTLLVGGFALCKPPVSRKNLS